MFFESIWISGPSRSGKTARLVEQFRAWVEMGFYRPDAGMGDTPSSGRAALAAVRRLSSKQAGSAVLVFAANGDNRIELADRIAAATLNTAVHTTTPLAFFENEVILFWPLLVEKLNLRAQFPMRLRPETEQELATQLWRDELDRGIWRQMGVNEYRFVRRALDLLLLAGLSGTPTEDIPKILEHGFPEEEQGSKGRQGDRETGRQGDRETGSRKIPFSLSPFPFPQSPVKSPQSRVTSQESPVPSQESPVTVPLEMLLRWREWCLERGLLTYGIIAELYWRYLLADATYQQHLIRRYRLVLADDVDDYPAIALHVFDFLLNKGAVGAFTYNPDGRVRLGLGADPDYMTGLASRCIEERLTKRPIASLEDTLGTELVEAVTDPTFMLSLPESVQSIQTVSRSQLLRQTAEVIAEAVNSGQVQPQEVAVIAPGLDAIARYTLIEILTSKGIPAESLNDQRPLSSSPIVRALLTLLALVYPGLGRLVDRDAIAEMLVVLSSRYEVGEFLSRGDSETGGQGKQGGQGDKENFASPSPSPSSLSLSPSHPFRTDIDPVRAGLLADYCYAPDLELPKLLPVNTFPRWDRLGYRATRAYEEIVQWLEEQRSQQQQRLIPNPVYVLDRAIQRFLWHGSYLAYDQISALRELLETAQQYWEVDARLRKTDPNESPRRTTIGRFIQLLRSGTVTANPFPVRSLSAKQFPKGSAGESNVSFSPRGAVTLANIFQYRSSRRFHRWQFWLDAGSPLWLKGGAATLFGATLFLQDRFGQPWTVEDEEKAGEERLQRILRDLLGRAGERVFLCHSDLAVNGQDQTGPLLTFINASVPIVSEVAPLLT